MPTPAIPADVLWSRGVRFHLHALLASAGIIVVLSVLAAAAVLMAGPLAQDPPITAGLVALLIGGLCAAAGAVTAGLGQARVLAAAPREVGGDEPGPAFDVVSGALGRTRRVFALLPRFAIAGCVAVIAGYTIWAPAGFWGALVGSLVVAQGALALAAIRRTLLSEARLLRGA